MAKNDGVSRRDLVSLGVGAAAATLLGASRELSARPSGRSRVVLVRHPEAVDGDGRPVPAVFRRMLDDGMSAFLQKPYSLDEIRDAIDRALGRGDDDPWTDPAPATGQR